MSQITENYNNMLTLCVDEYFKSNANYLLIELLIESFDPDMVKTEQHEPGFLAEHFSACIDVSAKKAFKALVSADYPALVEMLNAVDLDNSQLVKHHQNTMENHHTSEKALSELDIKRITFARMFVTVAKRKFGQAITDLHSSSDKKDTPETMSDGEKHAREVVEYVEHRHAEYLGLRRLASYCSLSTRERVDICEKYDVIEETPQFKQEFKASCNKLASWLSSYK